MTTGDSRLDPTAVAALDQIIASYSEWLNHLADSYTYCRFHEGDLITLGTVSSWLEEEFDPATMASLLAVSVRMLSNRVAGYA